MAAPSPPASKPPTGREAAPPPNDASPAAALAPFVAAGLGFAATLYFYYPGFMGWDATWQYYEVVTGRVTNPHPPIMVYTWMLADALVAGPAGMLVLHAAAYWAGTGLLAVHVFSRTASRAAAVVALGLFPPAFGLLPTMHKDAAMLSFLLLAVGLSLRARATGSRGWLASAVIAAFYATAVRTNAILTILPVLWLLADARFPAPDRRLRALAAAGLAIAFVVGIAALDRTVAVRLPYRAAVPMWDLAVISLDTRQMLLPDFARPNAAFGLAELKRVTQRHRCNFDGRGRIETPQYALLSHGQANRLFGHWLAAIRDHPAEYAAHRWHVTRALLFEPVGKVIHGMVPIKRLDLEFEFETRPGYRRLHGTLMALTRTILYQPWAYVLLALFVLGWSFRLRGQLAHLARVLSSSGLASVLPLVVIAPSMDFRYSIWLIVSALWAALCAWRAQRGAAAPHTS